MTFPFTLLRNLRALSDSSFSDNPSLDVTLGDDDAIAGVATSSLKSNYFWACNSPQDSTCPSDETMQLMSPQCYGIIDLAILMIMSELVVQIRLFKSTDQIDLSKINGCDLFAILDFRILKSQTHLLYVLQPTGFDDLQTPSLLNQWPCLYFGCLTFQYRSTVLWPSYRSTIKICFGFQNFEISNLKPRPFSQ
jgi:hypothetical protein